MLEPKFLISGRKGNGYKCITAMTRREPLRYAVVAPGGTEHKLVAPHFGKHESVFDFSSHQMLPAYAAALKDHCFMPESAFLVKFYFMVQCS